MKSMSRRMARRNPVAGVFDARGNRNIANRVRADVAMPCHAVTTFSAPSAAEQAGVLPDPKPLLKREVPRDAATVRRVALRRVRHRQRVAMPQRQATVQADRFGLRATEKHVRVSIALALILYQRHFRLSERMEMGNNEWAAAALRRFVRRATRRVAVALAAVRLLGVE